MLQFPILGELAGKETFSESRRGDENNNNLSMEKIGIAKKILNFGYLKGIMDEFCVQFSDAIVV